MSDDGAARVTPSPARVLPLRESVGFPETVIPLAIGQPRSIELVNDALTHDRLIVMVASRDPELEEPAPADLYDVGVVGVIARMMRAPDGTQRILVQCAQRVRIARWVREEPYLVAEVEDAPDVYVAKQLKAIVGIELVVESVEAKAKLSQNRSEEDRAGVVAGLDGTPAGSVADAMRRLDG